MSLYCAPCRQELVAGASVCHLCGGRNLACMTCHEPIVVGETGCRYCNRHQISRCSPEVPVDLSEDVARALASVPTPVRSLGTAVVPEVYKAGRYGVEAVVKIPPRDAEIMTELCRLVPLLHGMAARLNQFQGHTEHTRALIRDLRKVACDAQEEVELRRGPG